MSSDTVNTVSYVSFTDEDEKSRKHILVQVLNIIRRYMSSNNIDLCDQLSYRHMDEFFENL